MDTLEETLEQEISSAEMECKFKYGCRNATDCMKCELLKKGCVKTHIARRLIEKFEIKAKD